MGAWHQGPGLRRGAADRPPPGGAPLPLGAGAHGGTGLAVPCQDRALRHLHWFCLSVSRGQTISAFPCHEPHAGSASRPRIRSTSGQPHRCRHPLSLLAWPPHPWAREPRGLDVCPSLDRHTRSRSPPRTPPASPPVPSVPVSASGGAVGSLRASARVFVSFLRPRGAAAWGSKGVPRWLSHRPLAEGAQTHRHGSRGTAPHPPDGHLPALSLAVPRTRTWRFSPLARVRTHPPPSVHAPATCLLRQSSASGPCLRCQLGRMSGSLRSRPLYTCTSAPPSGSWLSARSPLPRFPRC